LTPCELGLRRVPSQRQARQLAVANSALSSWGVTCFTCASHQSKARRHSGADTSEAMGTDGVCKLLTVRPSTGMAGAPLSGHPNSSTYLRHIQSQLRRNQSEVVTGKVRTNLVRLRGNGACTRLPNPLARVADVTGR